MRNLGAVAGVAMSTAIQFAVMKSSLPSTLPSGIRGQLKDGSWEIGEPGSEAWESQILDAKMKGIRAVFILMAPLIGLCLLGCVYIPNTVLKGDDTDNGTSSRDRSAEAPHTA
jgi:hypothetical protein